MGAEFESFMALAGVYAILAISLNLLCGLTGVLQLGHAGFFAAGTYAAAITSIYFTIPQLGFFNIFISLAAGVTASAIFALLLGIPCLRLKGDYLAIATLGFGEIMRLCLNNLQIPGGRMFPDDESIGGPTGLSFTEFPGDLWTKFPDYSAQYAKNWVIWLTVVITFIIFLNIKNSSFGRAMMCIREDETAAKSLGISIPKYKMLAFILSAVFAGTAGVLFYHHELRALPDNACLMLSIEILLMLVLGGMGSFSGALMAAVVLAGLPFVLRHMNAGEYRQIIYALMLILIIRLKPDGLAGMKEISDFFRRTKK